MVVDQTDFQLTVDGLDVHFFELCLSGRHHSINKFEGSATQAESVYLPGRLYYLPAHREITAMATGEMKVLQLAMSRVAFDNVKAEILKGDPDKIDFLGFNGVINPQLKAYADGIHKELVQPSAGGALVVDALTQALAVEIIRNYSTGSISQNNAEQALSAQQLSRALEFIESTIGENEGLDSVANAAGLSPFHFSRAFKAATGKSPHQYLIERRIERAREMLSTTGNSIADVAYACGFSSQAHMTSTFSKNLGVTPGKYRKVVKG